jgi:hypothetical protein
MNYRIGRETRTFEEAFRQGREERWIAGHATFPALRKYFELFGRDRILALRFEDLASRPQSTVRQAFDFLSVDPECTVDISEVHNEGGLWKSSWLGAVTTSIRSNRPLMQALKRRIPAKMWGIAKRVHSDNLVKAPSLRPEIRNDVAEFYREDTERLQELVRLDLSGWLAK